MNGPTTRLKKTRLDCGLEIVTEQHPSRRSASFCWLVPGGIGNDPIRGGDGWATMISEYLLRGCDDLSSRDFSDALDRLGARRSVVADTYHQRIAVTVPGERLSDALTLTTHLIRRPTFPPAALEPVRDLCLQELGGIEDDPAHLVGIRLDEIRYPVPFDRHGLGKETDLRSVTRDDLADHWFALSRPEGAILTVAGAVDHEAVIAQVDRLAEGWSGGTPRVEAEGKALGGTRLIERQTSQVHLAVGFDAPLAGDPDALAFRTAVGVLGGGSSSRLFTEIRERRGLAYAIGSRYDEGVALGAVTISAGTTPERVAQTLEKIDEVLEAFDREGPTDEEIRRIVRMLRASGLMQQEEGPSRARQLALDMFRLGRPRSIEDILEAYAALDPDDVRRVASERMGPDWRAAGTRCLLGPAEAISA